MEVTGSRSCDDKICFPCVASKFENLGENSQTKEFTTGNLSLIFEGIKGRKGTKKPVFFLRHRHKDHAWKLYMGTHSRFKSENDLTCSVLFTNHSIQKFNCGSFYCNESVSVNRGISVLRLSLNGVFLIFTSLSSCFFLKRKHTAGEIVC